MSKKKTVGYSDNRYSKQWVDERRGRQGSVTVTMRRTEVMNFDKMLERTVASEHNHNLDPKSPFRLGMV